MKQARFDLLKSVLKRLQDELNAAHSARVAHVEKNLRSLRELRIAHFQNEPLARKRVDLACLHWIEHETWPGLEQQDDAVLIWERLNEAYLVGCLLYSVGFRIPKKRRDALLRFLLIQVWDVYGYHRLAAQIREL